MISASGIFSSTSFISFIALDSSAFSILRISSSRAVRTVSLMLILCWRILSFRVFSTRMVIISDIQNMYYTYVYKNNVIH